MNSFTLVGVGTLAGNPEVIAKGDISYVRFCLLGTDHVEYDAKAGRAGRVFTSVCFMAFDEIADRIARNSRKGDQLIVEARVSPRFWIDNQGESHCESAFIVTGFRFGAKRNPESPATATAEPPPINPCRHATEEILAMSA